MIKYLLLLITVGIISCSPIRKYQTLPEVKAWEEDIQKFELLDKIEVYPENSILFAGSSSIRLWSTLQQDMTPYPVIQRGYGGAKLSDFVVYADRIFNHHACDAIVIFIANDISGSDQDKNPKEVASLFRNLLKTIRKAHPYTPVFWIAITPTESRWMVWNEIQKANNLIENICNNEHDTYYIRTDFGFLNEKGMPIPEYFRDDKLHLTEKGYEAWTAIIKKELNKVLGK